MLVHKKEGKEQDTPTSAYFLCCSLKWSAIETRPGGLQKTQATAELEHHTTAAIRELKKKNLVFEPSALMQCEFGEINPIPSR